jgi:hypothetical protein
MAVRVLLPCKFSKPNMSSSDPKTLEEARPSFDDPASKEATESLTSTKTFDEADQLNKHTHD